MWTFYCFIIKISSRLNKYNLIKVYLYIIFYYSIYDPLAWYKKVRTFFQS